MVTRESPRLTRYAWLSIGAALVTITLKAAAYLVTGSVGLLSDAPESVVNLVAAVIALIALKVAARPPDAGHQYGHGKAEYFSAGLEGLMIFVAAAVILASAVERFLHPVALERLGAGLAISTVATAVNGAGSPDRIFHVTAHANGTMNVAVTNADYDAYLYVASDCDPATETTTKCVNKISAVGDETLDFGATADKTYSVFVDGTNGAKGNFKITFAIQ